MGYFEGLGFRIFRLREAKTESEYILYNINNKSYNEYSLKKLKEVIRKEINNFDIFVCEILEKDIKTFLNKYELNEDGNIKFNEKKEKAIKKCIDNWIEEEYVLLDNIGFYPKNQLIFENNEKKYFNIYKIPQTLIYDNYKLDKSMSFNEFKTLAPYHYKLLMNLHNNDELAVQDTLIKISDKIKYPENKSQDCIIFYPGEGAGKGIFYKYVINAIFGEYSSKVLMKRLIGDFNAFLRKSLVLILEEGKRDSELIEVLKEITTEGNILINEKGKNQQLEDIYFLTFVFSNNMNCIDLGKRRGSYHISKPLGKNINETSKLGKDLVDNLPKETDILLKYLHNLEFSHEVALIPYNTIAKEQITELNKTPLELFYKYICSFKDIETAILYTYNKYHGVDGYNIEIKVFNDNKYISKDIIRECYNKFCTLEGFKSNLISNNRHIAELWTIMNISDDSFARIRVENGDRRIDHVLIDKINEHILSKFNEK